MLNYKVASSFLWYNVIVHLLITLFFSSFCTKVLCYPLDSYELVFDFLRQDVSAYNFSTLPQPLLLSEITYSSDVLFQPEEFSYLVDLPIKTEITEDMLQQSLNYLYNKNKFSRVAFLFSCDKKSGVNSDQNIYRLHVMLGGFWTLDRVKFYGLSKDRDSYKHLYLLEAGERFALQKHMHSLQMIKKSLQEHGFFKYEVMDYFDYNMKTKSITVNIVLNPGRKFYIAENNIHLTAKISTYDAQRITQKLNRMNRKYLAGYTYDHQLLTQQLVRMKKYLFGHGFANCSIKVKRRVHPLIETVDLIFQIDASKKRDYIFFGNHFFSKQQLAECLAAFGPAMLMIPESIAQQELLQLYHAKGFLHCRIQSRKTDEGYYFLIQEGKRVRWLDIVFRGNQTINSEDLKEIVKKELRSVYVDNEELKDVVARLIEAYSREGFWQTKITYEHEFFQQDRVSNLHLAIDEGDRYFLHNVLILSHPSLRGSLPGIPCSNESIVFDASLIGKQRQWLVDHFHKHGYVYARVYHELHQWSENPLAFDLVWHVENAEFPVRFDKIIVQGSYTFPFHLLKKEIPFCQGDVWQQELVRELRSKLNRYDIFETIHVHPYKISAPEEYKPVLVKIIEDDPFEMRIRVGFQQVSKNLTFRKGSTYKLGGSFLWKNPSNAADCFQFDGDVTRFYRNICGEYRRPWLAEQPIWTVLKGYTNKYIQPIFIGSDKPLYQATQQGFLAGLRRRWLYLDVGITGGNEWMETNHLSIEVARAINFEPALIDKKVPYVFVEPNVVFNYLDNQLNPTSGLLTILSGKLMLPWQRLSVDEGFFKILFDQAIFFSPWTKLVLGLRLRFGHIFNKDFNRIMPPERFYLGGANSIRSYEPDFGPPLGCFIDCDGKKQFVPRGGRTMIAINIETRITVWRSLGIVLFQDLGTLVDAVKEFKKSEHLLAGTGFGLRYNTPIGPVRFDIGFKWHRCHKDEKIYAWFFTLGHAF